MDWDRTARLGTSSQRFRNLFLPRAFWGSREKRAAHATAADRVGAPRQGANVIFSRTGRGETFWRRTNPVSNRPARKRDFSGLYLKNGDVTLLSRPQIASLAPAILAGRPFLVVASAGGQAMATLFPDGTLFALSCVHEKRAVGSPRLSFWGGLRPTSATAPVEAPESPGRVTLACPCRVGHRRKGPRTGRQQGDEGYAGCFRWQGAGRGR